MVNYFEAALERCGVPLVEIETGKYTMGLLDNDAARFVNQFCHGLNHPNRLAIVGSDYLEWTIRLCRLRIAYKMSVDLKFVTYKYLYKNTYDFNTNVDTIVVCGIKDADDKNSLVLNSIIGECMTKNVNVILSSSSPGEMKQCCLGSWDFIDKSFHPIKV